MGHCFDVRCPPLLAPIQKAFGTLFRKHVRCPHLPVYTFSVWCPPPVLYTLSYKALLWLSSIIICIMSSQQMCFCVLNRTIEPELQLKGVTKRFNLQNVKKSLLELCNFAAVKESIWITDQFCFVLRNLKRWKTRGNKLSWECHTRRYKSS